MLRRRFLSSFAGLSFPALAVADPMLYQDLRVVTADGETHRASVKFPASKTKDYTAFLNAIRDGGVQEIESRPCETESRAVELGAARAALAIA